MAINEQTAANAPHHLQAMGLIDVELTKGTAPHADLQIGFLIT